VVPIAVAVAVSVFLMIAPLVAAEKRLAALRETG